MFFEQLGLFFFSKIRPAFFFLFMSLPLIFAGSYVLQRRLEFFELNDQYESTLTKAYKAFDTRTRKEQFLARYSAAEPYFLDQHIESMELLKHEIAWLENYRQHPALSENKLVENRLSHLTKGKNRIAFLEEMIRTSNTYKETDEKMKKMVEMDEEDLKRILSLIENTPIGSYQPHPKSPQMIVTDFSLKKKNSPFNQEIFEVKMNLLKREFTQ